MPVIYVSENHGDDANNGSTWALAKKTINGASAISAAGDEIRIEKSDDAVSTGINATFTNGGTIELATALTADIEMCDAGWTGETGATVTFPATVTRKQGAAYMSIAIANTTVAKKLAYKAIGGESGLNLSGYEQISLWYRFSVISAAGLYRICLCSDTAGDTPVDTFDLPAINCINYWMACVINKGSALGSAIKSIAIYSTDTTSPLRSILFDDIIACGAASANATITHNTLIGKNSGNEGWFHPESITGTTIIIGHETNGYVGYARGYSGTTESVTLYKRNPFLTTPAVATTTAVNTIAVTGTDGNTITFKGGYEYDTTNQNGESYYCGQSGLGKFIYITAKNYLAFEKILPSRYYSGYGLNTNISYVSISCFNIAGNMHGFLFSSTAISNITLTITNLNNNYEGINITSCYDSIFTIINCNSNGRTSGANGLRITGMLRSSITITNFNNNNYGALFTTCHANTVTVLNDIFKTYQNVMVWNTSSNLNNTILAGIDGTTDAGIGLYINGSNNYCIVDYIKNCAGLGINIVDGSSNFIKVNESLNTNISNSANISLDRSQNNILECPEIKTARYGVLCSASSIYIKDAVFSGHTYSDLYSAYDSRIYLDGCELNSTTPVYLTALNQQYPEIISANEDTVTTNHRIFVGYGTIESTIAADNLKYGSGWAWKLSPTSATDAYEDYPIFGPLLKVYASVGRKFTFNVWAKRSNAGIGGGIRIRPNGVNGLSETLESKITADADMWQQLSITFTSTNNGLIILEMFAYGGSAYNLILDPYQLPWDKKFYDGQPIFSPASWEQVITT